MCRANDHPALGSAPHSSSGAAAVWPPQRSGYLGPPAPPGPPTSTAYPNGCPASGSPVTWLAQRPPRRSKHSMGALGRHAGGLISLLRHPTHGMGSGRGASRALLLASPTGAPPELRRWSRILAPPTLVSGRRICWTGFGRFGRGGHADPFRSPRLTWHSRRHKGRRRMRDMVFQLEVVLRLVKSTQ